MSDTLMYVEDLLELDSQDRKALTLVLSLKAQLDAKDEQIKQLQKAVVDGEYKVRDAESRMLNLRAINDSMKIACDREHSTLRSVNARRMAVARNVNRLIRHKKRITPKALKHALWMADLSDETPGI